MKRHSSSDSLIPICPSASHGDDKGIYSRHFPSILDAMDDDECGEELCSPGHTGSSEKKRRLSTDQVRSLEKNFEVENKLDPERKVRLAQELGLQPRQVAVWFQNRRARWKTKQLERDYSALKASYDALRLDFDALHHDKQSLLAEIKGLKAKLANDESFSSVKEEDEEEEEAEDEPLASVSDIKQSEIEEEPSPLIYKDGSGSGSSDSDSSAVLNDDTSPYYPIMPAAAHTVAGSNTASAAYYPIMESRSIKGGLGFGFSFHHQLFKAEEHGFEEPCTNFFSDEQAPVLSWSCTDPWNWVDGGGDNNNNNNNNNNSNIGRRQGPF